MFLDEKELEIRAGRGGDGVALFRREIYVPRGGPDGGDGGDGGDVFICGQPNLHALSHLAHVEKIVAEDGKKGGHRRSTGKSGTNQTILVPLGTIIEEKQDNEWHFVQEIKEEGTPISLAKGGNGGWGNWHFRSSIQQAPERFNPGQPGEQRSIRLVLKLIADIGLVGFPNAGKSTFLSVVSAARPKIADYPFTTLEPQLGVAHVGQGEEAKQLVIADLPGIIEGASQGKGLGATFLKHIERTRTIIHCIDGMTPADQLLTHYKNIRKELDAWSPVLAQKSELIALTKIDALTPEEVEQKKQILKKHAGREVYPISAVTHQGLQELLTNC